jgi:AcrR family transcriptional regulator
MSAAQEVLLAEGVAAFTIDQVVARSGVAKSTIYRWWPSRQALLLDVIHHLIDAAATPNTGDTRADLRTYLGYFTTRKNPTPAARLMPELCAAAQHDPDLEELRDTLLAEKRQPVLTILQLAGSRGEIDEDCDLEMLATMIIGPLVYQRHMLGRTADPAMLDRVIDSALAFARGNATV